ncbi:MAG: ankyrin repeat domain-containing protein, partial [Candidatus Dependentiae bacterium]|nr:ankyrin repeat domain-containing protein [Candidatus Dependentiae bacterium]
VQQNDKGWIWDFRKKYNDFIDPTIKNNKGFTLYEEAKDLGFDDDRDSVGASLQKEFHRLGGDAQGAVERDQQNRTALMFALYRGNIDEAKKYINAGADVNAQDNNGFTPLHYAMLSPRPVDSLKSILEKNPAINVAERKFGNTPLLMVAQIEHAADRQLALKMLIGKGADLSIKNKKGQTLRDRINQQAKLGFKDDALIKFIDSYSKK